MILIRAQTFNQSNLCLFVSPNSGSREAFGEEGSNLKDRIRSVLQEDAEEVNQEEDKEKASTVDESTEKDQVSEEKSSSEQEIPKEDESVDKQTEKGKKEEEAVDPKPDGDQAKSRI